jgi:hypothetical protein
MKAPELPFNITEPQTKECEGCIHNQQCLPYSMRIEDDKGKGMYCDISGKFKYQMPDQSHCQNDYECQSNHCSDAKCVNLEKKIDENTNLIQKILDWLKHIFGG